MSAARREDAAARSVVPLPGEPFDGTFAECFGVVITDEARAEFDRAMQEIRTAEREADKRLHDRIYGVAHA